MMNQRRTFLKTLAALTAGIMVPYKDFAGNIVLPSDRFGELLPMRKLGNTGIDVTMLGLGGAHIGRATEKMAEDLIEAAIEGGIRFFDNAEMYNSGLAETRYGKYLVPKYRDISFIMTKTTGKDAKTVREHLEGSLKRMKTDYVDLYQIHSVNSPADVDSRIEEGVLEEVLKAKESGKVKYIGFTGHRDYKAHQRVLEQTDVLQTCQMPINCFDPNYKSFINNVMPTLTERNMGILAMKTLSNGGFFGGTRHFHGGENPKIVPNVVTVEEALHFVWSLPVSTIITGPDDVPMLEEKITLAKSFKFMEETDRIALVDRVAKGGFDGKLVEFYKA